ncbi:MAG: hypothetical protein AAGJ79_11140 [Verrucomicrobiota bacterium]
MRTLRIMAAIAGVAAAAWLALGPKPWKEGLASLEEGERARTIHHLITGEWYAALAILGIATLVFFLARWLGKPLPSGCEKQGAGVPREIRSVFWIAALLGLTLGCWTNGQRLNHSLWGDEEYTMKRMIIGDWSRASNDNLRIREVPWIDTVWRYRSTNNHQLNSILARAVHDRFHVESGEPEDFHFSEALLRLPAFVASLLGIVALGWFLAVFGFPRAGIIAMFLLPLHPWFIRFGPECRGYAFTFLFLPLCLVFLVKAVRRGSWPYWAGFLLAEFLLFFSYPGTFYSLVGINLAALACLFATKFSAGQRSVLLRRLFAANLGAGCLALVAFAPCVIPMREYLAGKPPITEHNLAWLADHLCFFASGMPWRSWSETNPFAVTLSRLPAAAAWPMIVFPAFFFLLGIVRILASPRRFAWILVALIVPWLLFYSITVAGEKNLVYHWYGVPYLTGFIALVALGLDALTSTSPHPLARRFGAIVMLAFYAFWFSVATGPVRENLVEHAVEPLAESVRSTREVVNPRLPFEIDRDVVTIGFCMATRGYDPAGYLLKEDDAALFVRILEAAGASEREVYVNFALPDLARLTYPKLMKFIDNENLFIPVTRSPFFGQTDFATRWVLQWTGRIPPLP